MKCVTEKKGAECAFMSLKGCNFNGGHCHRVVDDCHGCSRAETFETGTFCKVVPHPAVKWNVGSCNFATHVSRNVAEKSQKINPLKASKRAAGGK